MVNINVNQPITTPAHEPVLNSNGQPMTLGQAAIALLCAYIAPNVDDARVAVALAGQLAQPAPLHSIHEPGLSVLRMAVKANPAKLPAGAIGALASHLGVKNACP